MKFVYTMVWPVQLISSGLQLRKHTYTQTFKTRIFFYNKIPQFTVFKFMNDDANYYVLVPNNCQQTKNTTVLA